MANTLQKREDDIELTMHTYGNMLFRLCLITLGNASDAQDVVQETLIKYMLKAPVFMDESHKKAWLLRVATNQCKDILRVRKRHPVINVDEIKEFANEKADSGILEALMMLPEKYRMVLTLYYVEELSVKSIAMMIGRTPSAVKMRLQKGRGLLLETYQRECL